MVGKLAIPNFAGGMTTWRRYGIECGHPCGPRCGSCVVAGNASSKLPHMSSGVALNLGRYLARAAEQVPDRLAIACGNVQASYAEEERRVNSLGLALRSLGLQKGDRVAILQCNGRQFLETMLACFKTGLGVVPINARLHPEEVCYRVRDAEAAALVYGPEFTEAIASIRPALPDTRHFISLIASARWELDFESLVREHATMRDQTH